MAESYDEIVKKWYVRLRGDFTNLLLDKYRKSNMRLEDVENIYQDVFIAIKKNLQEGRIATDTSWSSYIMTVGLNMASKQYRRLGLSRSIDEPSPDEKDTPSATLKKIDNILQSMAEDPADIYNDPDAQSVLGDELIHTPEPCASLIRLHYYSGMKDAEIAALFPRYSSASTVKVTRSRCMKDLVYRVKSALYRAGIIDVKPVKK